MTQPDWKEGCQVVGSSSTGRVNAHESRALGCTRSMGAIVGLAGALVVAPRADLSRTPGVVARDLGARYQLAGGS